MACILWAGDFNTQVCKTISCARFCGSEKGREIDGTHFDYHPYRYFLTLMLKYNLACGKLSRFTSKWVRHIHRCGCI